MIKNLPVLQSVSAFCHLPFTKLICNGDGNVSMCCYQVSQLGSIFDSELIDLWNSPKSQEIRSQTLQGELHSYCSSWNVCPYLVQDKIPYPFDTHKDFKFPTWIEINLPDTHCNIGGEEPSNEHPACIMCIRNHRKPAQIDLTDLMCEKVKPLMKHLRHLCVLGIAEPFWKNKVFQVFEKLNFPKYKHAIRFETNTNATLLTQKTNERFFSEVEHSDVSFSIDAGCSDTFIKIRRIDAYDQILENIKNYIKLIDNNKMRNRHVTKIWNNINLLNVTEMVKMVEVAHELHVDKLVLLPTHDQCGNVSLGELLLNDKNVDLFAKNAELARKRAEDLGVFLVFGKPFDKVPPPVQQ